MSYVTDYPLLVFVVSFVVLWLSTQIGARVSQAVEDLGATMREDFGVDRGRYADASRPDHRIQLSMATSRYDQRKNLEEAEAQRSGTEYVRADRLPPRCGESARTT
jgi:hypothetical protein